MVVLVEGLEDHLAEVRAGCSVGLAVIEVSKHTGSFSLFIFLYFINLGAYGRLHAIVYWLIKNFYIEK